MKALLLLIASFTALCSVASPPNTDSLRAIANGKGPDSSKIKALNMLSKQAASRDSALHYAHLALEISKKAKDERGEVASIKRLGDIFFDINNHPQSLKYLLEAFKGYDKLKDTAAMIGCLTQIGNVYSREEDYEHALEYYRNANTLRRLRNEDERIGYFAIGKAHEINNQLDSALSYYQRAYEYFQGKPAGSRVPFVLIHLASVHLKKKNNLLALSYARMAGDNIHGVTDSAGISSIYTHMAEIFFKTGSRDSSLYYAHKGYNIGVRNKFHDATYEPALLLAELYGNDPERSYYYYRIGKTIQDTIFSRDKRTKIQVISFNEKERLREVSEKAEAEKITRRNNIQYAGIGLGLALFALLFIILSNSIIVNEKHVKFLGILILLMVFEFLNLVLHPYLGELTHHSPILMLLAMVVIAALLIPTHHHLEHWITKKMVRKNKRVRLTVAKKIVAELEKEELN